MLRLLPLLVVAVTATHPWTRLWQFNASRDEPTPRAAHSMLLSGSDQLVVYGGVGDDEDSVKGDAWMFDLTTREWARLVPQGSSRPHKRFHHSAAMRQSPRHEMYVFGGMSVWREPNTSALHYAQSNDLWRLVLDQEPPQWVLEPSTSDMDRPCNRSEATTLTYFDQMYLFGGIQYDPTNGHGKSKVFNDIWTFDYTTKRWTQLLIAAKRVPPPRFSHVASLVRVNGVDHMAIFGGRQLTKDDGWALLDDLWLFSFETHVWRKLDGEPAFKRAYTSMVTVNSSLWLFGGYFKSDYSTNGYVYDDTIQATLSQGPSTQFYKNNDTDPDQSFPTVRYLHRAVEWSGKMIVSGGRFQRALGDLWVQELEPSNMHAVTDVHELERSDMNSLYVACVLFSVFTVLFVFTLARCRIQYIHPGIQTHPLVARRGLSDKRLLELKTKKYEAVQTSQLTSADMCPICLADFKGEDEIRDLPCKHLFHVPCIDEWLRKNKTCPMCKLDIEAV
ncbi:hypothetical protein ACHHYP_13614 [Achlya hypogyna]|uniref:RING-type domain-containing protein n=1 Tax=Achlya hypogyna TaxID=1202772 RepID=A0A1V9ZFM0_ACHHY|nr:hypothetical protein ACHHYP_13614 [Achlya hypogyna]